MHEGTKHDVTTKGDVFNRILRAVRRAVVAVVRREALTGWAFKISVCDGCIAMNLRESYDSAAAEKEGAEYSKPPGATSSRRAA